MFGSLISNPFNLKHFGAALLLSLSLGAVAGHAQTAPAPQPAPSHYYVNGKLVSKQEFDQLSPKAIARMDVFKGQQALDYTHDPKATRVVSVQTR